jgi:hypothetical protein
MSRDDKHATRLAVHGLSSLEAREIASGLDGAEFLVESRTDRTYGDISAGVLLLILAPQAIRNLAAFLLRKTTKNAVRLKIEKLEPNGSRQTVELEFEQSSADPPTPAVMRSLAGALNMDVKTLLDSGKA